MRRSLHIIENRPHAAAAAYPTNAALTTRAQYPLLAFSATTRQKIFR